MPSHPDSQNQRLSTNAVGNWLGDSGEGEGELAQQQGAQQVRDRPPLAVALTFLLSP
jgi:hypothetical protein